MDNFADYDNEEEHFIIEALAQSDFLSLPLSSHPESARSFDPPIFFDLRPFRDAIPGLTKRVPHYSSYVSESLYTYLSSTLFDRGSHLVGSIPEPLPSTNQESASSNVLSHPSLAERRPRRAPHDRPGWSALQAYSVYYAPFYLLHHERDVVHVRGDDPRYRALPILAPNLTDSQLADCRFVARASPTYPSEDPTSPNALPTILTRDRAEARVFVALWLAPTGDRRRVSGWRVANRSRTNRFRMNLQTESDLSTRRERYASLNTPDTDTPEPDTAPQDDPTLEAAASTNSARRRRGNKVTTDGSGRKTLFSRGLVSTGSATVIAAASPDALMASQDPDDPEAIDEFDYGLRALDYFNQMLLYPRDIMGLRTKSYEESGDLFHNGILVQRGRPTIRTETTQRPEPIRGLEPPCDPELGGLFSVIELPQEYAGLFTDFSLHKVSRPPTAQQLRRERIHKRRPKRPDSTHAVIAPSGVAKICPSLLHLSLITPQGVNPAEAKLTCRTLSISKTQLCVRISMNLEATNPMIVGGRNCGATTLSSALKSTLGLADLPHDPEHPNYFLLEEPPLVALPPDANTPGTLTLLFRAQPDDWKNPLEPLPDHEYSLDED